MILVRNNIIPFPRYKLLTLWPFIFVHKKSSVSETDLNHEEIHGRQQLEMLIVLFLLVYCLEYLIRLIVYWDHNKARKMISFEQEAYDYEKNLAYLRFRPFWGWLKYLMVW